MSILGRFLGRDAKAYSILRDSFGVDNFVGRKTVSGERVTAQSAMRLGPYYAAIGAIGEDIAKIPKAVVRSLVPRGRDVLADHPVTTIFSERFNPDCDPFVGVECMTQWALGWGNGVAEIERDGRGNPVYLWPIHPSRVTLKVENGSVTYVVRGDDLAQSVKDVRLRPDEVFHLRGRGDQYQGYSVAQLHAETIGYAIAARGFAAAYFGNDTTLGMVASFAGKIDPKEKAQFRKDMQSEYQGAKNKYGILILDNGAKVERMAVAPQDAQMLESQEFSIEEVARLFRMPPNKIGAMRRASGWSTYEAASTDYVTDALTPWAVRWEKEAKRKLLYADVRVNLRFFFQGLLRGDYATRTAGYQRLILSGVMTPNEARELEDMNPSDDENADKLMVQGAMMLVEDLGRAPVTPPPPSMPSGGQMEPGDTEDPAENPNGDPAEEVPAQADGASAVTRAVVEAASNRTSRKVAKAYERHAAKHKGDMPAFQKWARSFCEGLRGEIIESTSPAIGDDAFAYAGLAVLAINRSLLNLFASGDGALSEVELSTMLTAICMERHHDS